MAALFGLRSTDGLSAERSKSTPFEGLLFSRKGERDLVANVHSQWQAALSHARASATARNVLHARCFFASLLSVLLLGNVTKALAKKTSEAVEVGAEDGIEIDDFLHSVTNRRSGVSRSSMPTPDVSTRENCPHHRLGIGPVHDYLDVN